MNGATLKTFREAMGLSLDELADKLEVTSRMVSNWENDCDGECAIPTTVGGQISGLWNSWAVQLGEIVEAMGKTPVHHGEEVIHLERPSGCAGLASERTARIQAVATVVSALGFKVVVDWE